MEFDDQYLDGERNNFVQHTLYEVIRITTIFQDFLPECQEIWESGNLVWDPVKIGKWYALLKEQRKRDQAVLDIMMS